MRKCILISPGGIHACLNMEEERVPEEIRTQSVLISGDSAQVIRELIS